MMQGQVQQAQLMEGNKPDIGADEFDGVILDNTGPSISYTKLGFTCRETNDRDFGKC